MNKRRAGFIAVALLALVLIVSAGRMCCTLAGSPAELERTSMWPYAEAVTALPNGEGVVLPTTTALLILDEPIVGIPELASVHDGNVVVILGKSQFKYDIQEKWFALIYFEAASADTPESVNITVPFADRDATLSCSKWGQNVFAGDATTFPTYSNFARYVFFRDNESTAAIPSPPRRWIQVERVEHYPLPESFYYGLFIRRTGVSGWSGALAVPNVN